MEMKRSRRAVFVLSLMAVGFLASGRAADDPAGKSAGTTSAELAQLRGQLEEQQKQIEQLSALLAAQKKVLDQLSSIGQTTPVHMPPNLGEVASTTGMIPSAPATPTPRVFTPHAALADASSPLQLKIGDATI